MPTLLNMDLVRLDHVDDALWQAIERETAARIYADIKSYAPEFRSALAYLTQRFGG